MLTVSGARRGIVHKQGLLTIMIILLLCGCVLGIDEHLWASLQQLKEGQSIELVQKDMKSHEGTFLRFSQESISLREKGTELTVERSQILRINSRGKPKRFRNALIGGLLGSVIGSVASSEKREITVPVCGWVGVAVGALLPLHPQETIYRTE